MADEVDVAKLRELLAHATPGPWEAHNDEAGPDGCAWGVSNPDLVVILPDFVGPSDAQFIAEARNQLPAILAELETLRARVAELEE